VGYVYEYIDSLIAHICNGRLPDGLADGEVGVGFFGGFEGGEHGVSVHEQVGHELIGYAATAQSVELSCRGRAHSVEVRYQVGSRLFREVNGNRTRNIVPSEISGKFTHLVVGCRQTGFDFLD
jgi:hypothetical protein